MSQQLNQKQLLFYMKDAATQSLLVQQNWAGAIDKTPNVDSIMVVDANLASLKTDSVMNRSYSYSVKLEGDRPVATLTIHYNHTGKFDWRTSYLITRYNTYVRVYVPSGSELISSSGSQRRQQSQAAGKIETSTELGKTVFAAFKSIEPGTQSDLKLTYRLPATVGQQLKNKAYKLVWQKQAGMMTPALTLAIDTPNNRPTSVDGLDNEAKLSHSAISFTGVLSQDRTITAHY